MKTGILSYNLFTPFFAHRREWVVAFRLMLHESTSSAYPLLVYAMKRTHEFQESSLGEDGTAWSLLADMRMVRRVMPFKSGGVGQGGGLVDRGLTCGRECALMNER
jgi:hypothetical protein